MVVILVILVICKVIWLSVYQSKQDIPSLSENVGYGGYFGYLSYIIKKIPKVYSYMVCLNMTSLGLVELVVIAVIWLSWLYCKKKGLQCIKFFGYQCTTLNQTSLCQVKMLVMAVILVILVIL